VVPWEQFQYDPIKKFKGLYYGSFITVVLHESGKCDLYHYYQRKYTITNMNIVDINVASSSFFLKVIEGEQEVIYKLDASKINDCDINFADKLELNQISFDKVFFEAAQNFVDLFSSAVMVRNNENTDIIISH
jgi:hypothetical protein